MSDKIVKSRIVHKHDTEANWLKATNFIPYLGEIIIYDKDNNYNYERIKVGDGVTIISSLPFVTDPIKELIGENKVSEQISEAISDLSYIDVDLEGSTYATPNPVNADTLGGYSVKDIIKEVTPVKGTDYWTEADKDEIKSYVDEAILGGVW